LCVCIYIYILYCTVYTGRRRGRTRSCCDCCQTNKLYSSAWEARKTRRAPRPRRLCRRKTTERERKKKFTKSRHEPHAAGCHSSENASADEAYQVTDGRTDGRTCVYLSRALTVRRPYLCVCLCALSMCVLYPYYKLLLLLLLLFVNFFQLMYYILVTRPAKIRQLYTRLKSIMCVSHIIIYLLVYYEFDYAYRVAHRDFPLSCANKITRKLNGPLCTYTIYTVGRYRNYLYIIQYLNWEN